MLKHPYFYVMLGLLFVVLFGWSSIFGLGKQYDCGYGKTMAFNALTGAVYLTYQDIQYVGSLSSGKISWETESNALKLPKTLTLSSGHPDILLTGGFAGSDTLCKRLN